MAFHPLKSYYEFNHTIPYPITDTEMKSLFISYSYDILILKLEA